MAVGQPGLNGFRPSMRASGLVVARPGRVQAQLRDTGGQVYNVLAYGLVGDNWTDNTPALQALIDKLTILGGVGGGEIYFPPGAYLFRSVCPADSGCHLLLNGVYNLTFRGAGESTQLGAISTDKDLFRLTGTSTGIQMADMTLDRMAGAIDGGNGIHFYNSATCPRFRGSNLLIQHHRRGVMADSARPQDSYWDACRFWSNTLHGIELQMNNDEHFVNCEFFFNGGCGAKIGNSVTPTRSDGGVYFANCAIYGSGLEGLKIQGTSTEPCWNVFWDGGIIDSNNTDGVAIVYAVNVRLQTRVSYNLNFGVYINNSYEISLTGLEVADSSRDGLVLQGPVSHVMGGGITTLSNGHALSAPPYFGVRIIDDVTYLSLFAGSSGNAQNGGIGDPSLNRQVQGGGCRIEQYGLTPDNIELDGWSFPTIATGSKFVTIGVVGANITLREANTSNMLDIVGVAQSTKGRNQTLDSGYTTIIQEEYTIDAGTYLEIGAGSLMEIS
jgi:hypothetical protein